MGRTPIRSPFPASALRPNGAPRALSDTLKRGEVGASLKGQFYQYQRHGKWVTAKWPKKRGKPKSAAQSQAQKDFAAVCRAIKLTAAEVQMYARANAAGTPMLPRDAMMAALYGNGPTIRTYSGKVIKPMSNKLLSSTVLDAIGWQEGDILFRGKDAWEVLPQGGVGLVLQSNGPGNGYQWVEGGAGSKPVVFYSPPIGGVSSSAFRVKGQMFRPLDAWEMDRAYCQHQMPLGQTLDFTIAFIDAARVITEIPIRMEGVATGTGALTMMGFDLSYPVHIPAQQRVVLLYSLHDLPTGTPLMFSFGGLVQASFPVLPEQFLVNSNSLPINIGDVLPMNASQSYYAGARLK